ncbi:MAG: glycosyltransferase [Muribaculaceae bacterium]|nr:glycosyltransferase [Muribaculaceae bacterium]
MESKKILLITDALVQGGAERQIVNLAIGLKKRNYNIRLISFYPYENFFEKLLTVNNINVETYENGINGLKRSYIIYKLVRLWKPNAVITYKGGPSMAACIARLFTKFNLIVSERNITLKKGIKDYLKFNLFRKADYVVPNSFTQGKYIEENFSFLKKKIKVINNMVDTETFKPSDKNFNNEKINIITTARISPQKNILNYLHAIHLLKKDNVNCHFNWYGRINSSDDYWNQIEKKIINLDIGDMVTFHGPKNNIVEKYHENDIFILPSYYEGFPNVLCEAMACGLPCIASNVSDSPYILNNENCIVDPNNPYNIAEVLKRMIIKNKEIREVEGEKNRLRILDLCSEEKFLDNYSKLF